MTLPQASWLTMLLSYGNCVLIHGDFLKLRAACGTRNCLHSDFIQSNNSIRCYRNLILMIISIYNSPSLNKCLHWRGISMEKVILFKNANFFCKEIKWDAKLFLSLCCPSLLSTYRSDQYDISHVAMQMGKFTSWWKTLVCPFVSSA